MKVRKITEKTFEVEISQDAYDTFQNGFIDYAQDAFSLEEKLVSETWSNCVSDNDNEAIMYMQYDHVLAFLSIWQHIKMKEPITQELDLHLYELDRTSLALEEKMSKKSQEMQEEKK